MDKHDTIDYIVEAVNARGSVDRHDACNDFGSLILKKEFQDLISLEIYETYFWEDRHEFDFQLLQNLVQQVGDFFSNPNTIMQLRDGLLQNLPTAIIVGIAAHIGRSLKVRRKDTKQNEDSCWAKIENNAKKIDEILKDTDYIPTEKVEKIFHASREEILPLLKLYGCKCYIQGKKSVWIKPGTRPDRVNEILKTQKIKLRH